jgi:hypothetical protein
VLKDRLGSQAIGVIVLNSEHFKKSQAVYQPFHRIAVWMDTCMGTDGRFDCEVTNLKNQLRAQWIRERFAYL